MNIKRVTRYLIRGFCDRVRSYNNEVCDLFIATFNNRNHFSKVQCHKSNL